MTSTTSAPTTREEMVARGKAARDVVPLDDLAALDPGVDRDVVGLLAAQGVSRVPELVPVRHARMSVSAFTFYRGAALPMAADLARTPSTGLTVQLCGDAHLANFGVYASPERQLVFDLNDFDETLPGPFEWDVKRLVSSLEIAGRANGFRRKERARVLLETAAAYRHAMREFARQPLRDVWYSHVRIDEEMARVKDHVAPDRYQAMVDLLAKARGRDTAQAMRKLTTVVDGRHRIRSDPPLIVPVEDLLPEWGVEEIYDILGQVLDQYAETLVSNRRHLVRQYRLVHVARKVVGVGSVGTRAWVMLLESADGTDFLFLQAKEAQESVLAPYAGASTFDNQGERVVAGQMLMQAVSDPFLGWQRIVGVDDVQRDYYVRQLRDWKASLPVEEMVPTGLAMYGRLCATTLARAHARSGNRVEIAAYLGKSDRFERAIAEFATAYADLNDQDHASMVAAIASGDLPAAEEA
ncbi:DUF2252 domain-containing protein [Nocardioides sp.]|uniref:DUF2252 domain-containing protein n=1 Tax=Nocardioides sp. TaxID=35761 RepID=UPI00378455AD